MMRSFRVVAAVILLLLAACAEQAPGTSPGAPAATQAPTAVVRVATATAAGTEPATAGPVRADGTPIIRSTARPTPVAGATAAPPPADASWPMLLESLNFGLQAGNSYEPRAVAVDAAAARLYVRTHARDTAGTGLVAVFDLTARPGQAGEPIAVAETGPDPYAEGPLAVDAARGHVLAVNPGDATCTVLDARTLKPAKTLAGVTRLALDEQGGRLYVAGLAGLRALDAGDFAPRVEAPLDPRQELLALEVDAAAGRLYLAHRGDAGSILTVFDAATLEPLATLSLPGRPDSLAADPQRGRLYLSLNDGDQDLLWTLDTAGRRLAERRLGDWLQKTLLALDPAGGRLFLARDAYSDYAVTVIDLDTGRDVADIALPGSPHGLAWDAPRGRLLVSHAYVGRLSVLDVDGGQVAGGLVTTLDLEDLALDPQRRHLYVLDTSGRLRVLDLDDPAAAPLAELPAEGRLSVDSAHGRFYSGGTGEQVRVFDSDRLRQAAAIDMRALPVADTHSGGLYLVNNGVFLASLDTLTVTESISGTLPQMPGFSPNPAAVDAVVDPGSGRVFVIINNGVPGSNNGNYLYVYEAGTYERTLVDGERSPLYLDVDPTTGRAYVARVYMDRRAISLIEEGRTYTARLDGVFGRLRVDPELDRLYVTAAIDKEGRLLVLDAANLDVLGSVSAPQDLSLYALDPVQHRLYLASPGGQVQVWSATGGSLPPAEEAAAADLAVTAETRFFLAPGEQSMLAIGGLNRELYRSDDAGATWLRLGGGLPEAGAATAAISPAWPQDPTLFAAKAYMAEGLGIWKSVDGGQSWRMVSAGLNDLAVSALVLSPGFARDQTLFATAYRGGLHRSTDAGESWTPLTDRYRPEDAYDQPPGLVALSPSYEADRTLFISHHGLQRSTDGGQTWRRVAGEMAALVLSPDFARDRTLFAWSGRAGLLRSFDAGETWEAAGVGLDVTDFGSPRLMIAPDFASSQTLYLVWTPGEQGSVPRFFRSTDGARTWERLAGDPPKAATPLELSADGSAFVGLEAGGRLVRRPVSALRWQRVEPIVAETEIDHLVLLPGWTSDRALYAVTLASSILRSTDSGLTWRDTGWPVRVSFGDAVELAVVEPETLLAGSVLGLYRSERGGPWRLVGDGLPPGLAVSTPVLGPDGSLRLRAGGDYPEQGPRTFISTDAGRNWTEPIPPLPLEGGAEDLLLSPAVAEDRTAFFGSMWQPALRTLRGGPWQEIGPAGQVRLSWLRLSPAFDRDGVVLARYEESGLWRSTDRGDNWTQIPGPWGAEAPNWLTFLPEYERDTTLLGHTAQAVYRSGDGGATWQKVLDTVGWAAQVVASPGYAADATLYLVQPTALHRSTDGGRTWSKLPRVPWSENDDIHLVPSPALAQDHTLLAWSLEGGLFRSVDGGQSWRDWSAGVQADPGGLRQVVFSPDYARDGLAFLVPYGPGIYKSVAGGAWVPVTEHQAPQPTPPPVTRAPQPTATRAPQPTPTPAAPPACAAEPVRFKTVWQQPAVRARLGCPLRETETVSLGEQAFKRGLMIWDGSDRQIYVLHDSGRWLAFADTWVEGVDPPYDPSLAPPPAQPVRGFGKVWREQLGGPQAEIGWAQAAERGVQGWRQPFDGGLLLWTDDVPPGGGQAGTAYLLYSDGTWEAVAAP